MRSRGPRPDPCRNNVWSGHAPRHGGIPLHVLMEPSTHLVVPILVVVRLRGPTRKEMGSAVACPHRHLPLTSILFPPLQETAVEPLSQQNSPPNPVS